MSDESSFTRRRFTLTEQLDRDLQKLAERNYGGNVSLCLRSAISEHESTLSGEGKRALQRLEREVRKADQQTTTLAEEIEELTTTVESNQSEQRPELPFSTEEEQLRDSKRLYRLCCQADSPLRVADMIEQTSLTPRRVLAGLEILVDLAYVTQTGNGRYQSYSKVGAGVDR